MTRQGLLYRDRQAERDQEVRRLTITQQAAYGALIARRLDVIQAARDWRHTQDLCAAMPAEDYIEAVLRDGAGVGAEDAPPAQHRQAKWLLGEALDALDAAEGVYRDAAAAVYRLQPDAPAPPGLLDGQ